MKKGESQLQQVQENVEEVQIIMNDNVTRVREREAELEELVDRAETLLMKGKQFEKTKRKVAEKNTCLRFKKWQRIMIILGAVVLVIIIIISCVLLWPR
ncbi:vesicle-associated membrane protein 1-like isoform X2 [Neoarius graeffei]|uniref:vesicle-associated membrane protein 1-like isoform X2 n=1 Tax=Neoarius graeffei TaxID=443677 RepID=UPI00298BD8DE|nr:vesicle-associated membrane protein 1-like isoform X2 [Neoarius graeffei]